MAITSTAYSVLIRDNTTGLPVTTGSFSLRVSPYTNPDFSGVHQHQGTWAFLVNTLQKVKLYNDGTNTEVADFTGGSTNGFYPFPGYIDAAQIETGTINNARLGTGIDAAKIGGGLVSTTEFDYLNGASSNIQTQLTARALKAGDTYTGTHTFSDDSTVIVPTGEASNEAVNKGQLDSAISGIALVPYQESGNMRNAFTGASTVPNKDYPTIVTAINSATSPSPTRQYQVLVKGTGTTSQYISLNHDSLINYVHLKAAGKHIKLLLGVANATPTKTVTFEDFSIYMGVGDGITGARTYSQFTFDNCDIYFYQDLTFTSTFKLINCRLYSATGNTVTLTGATGEIQGTNIMQSCDNSGFTGITDFKDEVLTTYSIIADPTVSV